MSDTYIHNGNVNVSVSRFDLYMFLAWQFCLASFFVNWPTNVAMMVPVAFLVALAMMNRSKVHEGLADHDE